MDVKTFWRLIGARPNAVPIVAARDDKGPAGLLAMSVAHVSAEPPSLSVAVGQGTSALTTIRNSSCFAISYLPEDAAETADIFGGKGSIPPAERFADGAWDTLQTGAPVFRTAVATLDCIVDRVFGYHGTEIIVGRLVAYSVNADRRPLMTHAGRYLGWPF